MNLNEVWWWNIRTSVKIRIHTLSLHISDSYCVLLKMGENEENNYICNPSCNFD